MHSVPTIYLDYSNRSHVLVGDFKDEFSVFREKVLTPSKDFIYNPKLKVGKGWLIDKEKYSELLSALLEHKIIVSHEDTSPEKKAGRPVKKKRLNYRTMIMEAFDGVEQKYLQRDQIFKSVTMSHTLPKSGRHHLNKVLREMISKGLIAKNGKFFYVN